MKKICLFLLIITFPIFVNAEELNLAKNAKSAIMIETSTGEILYSKNKDERLAPASMTKIMSLIIIMENIEKGNIKWTDIVVVSKNAASMGGSQVYLEPNEMMTVEDLIKAMCIASGNDATVAMAEKIAGTEEAFVELMNKKVKKIEKKNGKMDVLSIFFRIFASQNTNSWYSVVTYFSFISCRFSSWSIS